MFSKKKPEGTEDQAYDLMNLGGFGGLKRTSSPGTAKSDQANSDSTSHDGKQQEKNGTLFDHVLDIMKSEFSDTGKAKEVIAVMERERNNPNALKVADLIAQSYAKLSQLDENGIREFIQIKDQVGSFIRSIKDGTQRKILEIPVLPIATVTAISIVEGLTKQYELNQEQKNKLVDQFRALTQHYNELVDDEHDDQPEFLQEMQQIIADNPDEDPMQLLIKHVSSKFDNPENESDLLKTIAGSSDEAQQQEDLSQIRKILAGMIEMLKSMGDIYEIFASTLEDQKDEEDVLRIARIIFGSFMAYLNESSFGYDEFANQKKKVDEFIANVPNKERAQSLPLFSRLMAHGFAITLAHKICADRPKEDMTKVVGTMMRLAECYGKTS